jgi:outer membrane protein TolC
MSLGWSSSVNPLFRAESWTVEQWSDNIGLGLSVSVPIDSRISGSSADLSLQKSSDAISKLRITIEDSRSKLETRVRTLLLDLELSDSNIEASSLNVSLQEQNYRKVRDNFESGLMSLLDLDSAQQELQKARTALENEKLNRLFIILELQKILGIERK